MTDLSRTIAPKSDQLNADDLIGKTLTIKVTDVKGVEDPQQPIAIRFEGDNGKPYKPCKSMRRVLVHIWGADGKSYVGRYMTLYRDEKVKFGGIEVGGIRISHMSHMQAPVTMALTASKAKRAPYKVLPLENARQTSPAQNGEAEEKARAWSAKAESDIQAFETKDDLTKWMTDNAQHVERLKKYPEVYEQFTAAYQKRLSAVSEPDPLTETLALEDDDFPGDRPAPEQQASA